MASNRAGYPAKRRTKEKLMSTPDPVTAPGPVETVQQLLADARTVSLEPERAAALAHISAALPVFEAGIRVFESWLVSPVTPKLEAGEEFPAYPDVPALLHLANAQVPADPEIPPSLAEPFLRVRERVNGYAAAVPRAKAAKEAFPSLRPKDFERPAQWRGTPFWPEGGGVARLRADLQAMAVGRDSLDDAARYLAVTLEALLKFSRARKAAGVRQATLAAAPPDDVDTRPLKTSFDPRARTR